MGQEEPKYYVAQVDVEGTQFSQNFAVRGLTMMMRKLIVGEMMAEELYQYVSSVLRND